MNCIFFVSAGISADWGFKLPRKNVLTPDGQHITVDDGHPKLHTDDLNFLKERIEVRTIKPVIDRCYPLERMLRRIGMLMGVIKREMLSLP